MDPTLVIVSFQGRRLFNLALQEARLRIGASGDNELVLNGPGVAPRHAVIERSGAALVLSRIAEAGAWLNGRRAIPATRVGTGDRLAIGDWLLEFAEGRDARDREAAGMGQTVACDGPRTSIVRDGALTVPPVAPLLIVREPSASPRHFAPRKRSVLIGNAPDCDLKLSDDCVSRRHALLHVRGDDWMLTDLGSTNGTILNGCKIRETALTRPAEFRLGRSVIAVTPRAPTAVAEATNTADFGCMVGAAPLMRRLFRQVALAAAQDSTVLILGPTGSGKEMVARALHGASSRRERILVTVNCGAIAATLAESELFGHEKGAFTGAEQARPGVFELADGGCVFLDEIGELSPELQSKVLRVMEHRAFRRLGGTREIAVNVRVIAATHRNLFEMVRTGKFREDLFYRLYVLPLKVPALSERAEDVEPLVRRFLKEAGREAVFLEPGAWERLSAYAWPGNVRELRHVVARALAFCREGVIRAHDIRFASQDRFSAAVPASFQPPPALADDRRRWETERLREALKHTGGNKIAAARLLRMGRSTFFRKLKEDDILGGKA